MTIMRPDPLQSFMATLFSSPNSFEEDLIKYEDDAIDLHRVTTVVYKLTDLHIHIVQDNACMHAKSVKKTSPLNALDISGSQKRWSHDASADRDDGESKVVNQPRCPRRRLSMELQSSSTAATTECPETDNIDNCNSIPKCPRRLGTMEFVSPTIPDRLPTRRHSLDETKDANTRRPRFPQRRGSITLDRGASNDRIANRPQRRASLVCSSQDTGMMAQQFLRSNSLPSVYTTQAPTEVL